MATQRKDGRWQVSVRIDGQRKYAYGHTRQAAEQAAAGLRLGMAREHAQVMQCTVQEYAEQWLARTANPATQASYGYTLRQYVLPVVGSRRMATVKRSDVQRLLDGIDHGPRTVRYAHGVLRAMLNEAVAKEHLSVNPAVGVRLPKLAPSPAVALTTTEAKALLSYAGPWAPMFHATLGLGLRKSEVIGLRSEDVSRTGCMCSVLSLGPRGSSI
ncbi:MAG: hypothetical protein WD645_06460 [Dehalococcoidia bacterium]